jgi:hypothetical protein
MTCSDQPRRSCGDNGSDVEQDEQSEGTQVFGRKARPIDFGDVRESVLRILQCAGQSPFAENCTEVAESASDCGITADINIWDMGDSNYPITDEPPPGIQKEFLAKGYDVLMHRYPDQGGQGTVLNIKGRKLDEGLPSNDVHCDRSEDPKYNSGTNFMQFYWDFTGGNILIDGKYLGFTKGDWIRLGTPTHPKILYWDVRDSDRAHSRIGVSCNR